MLPINTILHPTDLSEHARVAFRLASALARDYRAKLIILHVWSPVPGVLAEVAPLGPLPLAPDVADPATLQENLKRFEPADASLHVTHLLEEGDPADVILRRAKEDVVDLIVMGTHGRTGLSRLLLGSVAEQVLRQSRCPVMTVKTMFPDAEPTEARVAHAVPPIQVDAAV